MITVVVVVVGMLFAASHVRLTRERYDDLRFFIPRDVAFNAEADEASIGIAFHAFVAGAIAAITLLLAFWTALP